MRLLKLMAANLMAVCLLAQTTSCGTKTEANKEAAAVAQTTSATDSLITPLSMEGIIKAEGILKSAEDAPYPMFNLSITFPDKNTTEDFSLNAEDVKTSDNQPITSLLGKRIAFEYKKETENVLLDILYKGKSVFPKDEVPASKEGLTAVTGILSNAAEITSSDLPDEVYIKTTEGVTDTFPLFISAPVVKVNGKQVTGYYEKRTHLTVVSFKPIK